MADKERNLDSPKNTAELADPVGPATTSRPLLRFPALAWQKWLLIGGGTAVLLAGVILMFPWAVKMVDTVSTDDAYVNGHVTFVACRVNGQVSQVLVEDNMRVKKGDLLVVLDKTPFRVQVESKQAAAQAARADLQAARAQAHALLEMAISQRWQLQSAIEQLEERVANLHVLAAVYHGKQATLKLARDNTKRAAALVSKGGISGEDYDTRKQTEQIDEANVDQALQSIFAARVSLGLPAQPARGVEPDDVPADLAQTYSGVRTALANMVQSISQLGLPLPAAGATPAKVLATLNPVDLERNRDEIVDNAPTVKQAQAKVLQARRDLEQAQLNLSYCDVVSEIDGIVSGRNVNPGNNVQAGQSFMAVRSITQIWIDANFRETQLADLRIGQRVSIVVDMYGSRHEFTGRVTGFSMGTGQTLSVLPVQNATGNFVKVVQRLPVRIELTDYNPKRPLFIGLSVTPYVYYKEPPTGPHAGDVLQPLQPLPQVTVTGKRGEGSTP